MTDVLSASFVDGTVLQYDFMRRALVAAFLVGLAAPSVGIYIVQRRLALIGDGLGHVSLAGVAVGLFTGSQPVLTALIFAIGGAVAIELVRAYGRTSGDIALALLFYGGIAGGVVIISQAEGGTPANLNKYLFGAITTTSAGDVRTFAVLAAGVLLVTIGMSPRLFAVSNDEEYSRAAGLPVLATNLLLAVMTSVTVVISMRVVGLLLISALMVVPVATAQLVANSFRRTLVLSMAIGVVVSLAGVTTSYSANTPSGGTIVLFAIGLFVVTAAGTAVLRRWRTDHHVEAEDHLHRHGPACGHEAIEHEEHVDYVHDGHRHAPHGSHYDEHGHDHAPAR